MNEILDDHFKSDVSRNFYLSRVLYILIIIFMILGTIAAEINIESVVISAPVEFFLATLLLFINKNKNQKYTFIGLSVFIFTLGNLLYIWYFEIGPEAADKFLPYLIYIYDTIVIFYLFKIDS